MNLLFSLSLFLVSLSAFADNIQVINHGIAGFEKRFEMIDRAEQSIDVEYFIYKEDQAGRLFTQALIKKKAANPNVKIRIMVDDALFTEKLEKNAISGLEALGIEVKYYNPSSLFHIKRDDYRDHRKLIVIDGKEAITGSRNIANEYFDLASDFNFRDRDIWVQGPIVADMKASFEAYWASDWAFPAPTSKHPNKKGTEFLTENEHDRFLRGEIARVGAPILADPKSQGTCNTVSFVTDIPGPQSPETRKVLNKVLGRMSQMNTTDKLYAESPYFIVRDQDAKDEMQFFKDKNIQTVLLTNSLASTDAFYIAANFYPRTSFYQWLSDSKMYIFNGKTPANIELALDEKGNAIAGKATWGIHAKTFVFSDSSFAIGTFNLDPRSANLNNEMLLFCEDNSDLAGFVVNDIQSRIDQSGLLGKDGTLENGGSIFDGVSMMKHLEFDISKWPSTWLAPIL